MTDSLRIMPVDSLKVIHKQKKKWGGKLQENSHSPEITFVFGGRKSEFQNRISSIFDITANFLKVSLLDVFCCYICQGGSSQGIWRCDRSVKKIRDSFKDERGGVTKELCTIFGNYHEGFPNM